MQLMSKYNKGIRFLLCVIDIFSKYTWVISLKNKKCIIITNVFQRTLKESNPQPKSEFYNKSMKSWLDKNAIELYSIHNNNDGKSVVAER